MRQRRRRRSVKVGEEDHDSASGVPPGVRHNRSDPREAGPGPMRSLTEQTVNGLQRQLGNRSVGSLLARIDSTPTSTATATSTGAGGPLIQRGHGKSKPKKPEVEVAMGEVGKAGAGQRIVTKGLSDCVAFVAIKGDRRVLYHALGGRVEEGDQMMARLLAIAPDRVIIAYGTLSNSKTGREIVDGQKEVEKLLKGRDVERVGPPAGRIYVDLDGSHGFPD